jgi:tetratricopeptide (TPR) repeat protein
MQMQRSLNQSFRYEKRLLGEEHPDTIHAMGNLASTYESLGKYADAQKLKIKVLDMRNRLLGEDHPDTIEAMSNLAITYESLGKYADAEKLTNQSSRYEKQTSWRRSPRYNHCHE